MIIFSNYKDLLAKFIKLFNESPSDLKIERIEKIMNKLGTAIDKFDPKNLKLNFNYIKNTEMIYMKLLKIVNLAKNMQRKDKKNKEKD